MRQKRPSGCCIEGRRIYLRKVCPFDVNDDYLRWMNDPEITRYLESRFFPYSKERLEAYVTWLSDDPDNVFLAIMRKDTDTHIGNIKLGPINWIHRHADIGLVIGEKNHWGQGIATEAIRLVTEYAFNQLNLHKVTAGCYSNNIGSLKAFKKASFEQEGLLKSHCFYNGEYVDKIVLGLVHAGKRNA